MVKKKIIDLITIGMFVPKTNAIKDSLVFLVPKKGAKKFRLDVDLRLLNKCSKKVSVD